MSKFSKAFGISLNKDLLRIRSFEFNGHTFKVKVPLTSESDAMFERLKTPDEALIEQYYQDMSKSFTEPSDTVQITENDVLVEGKSIREAAKSKVLIQARVVEMMRLLVPEEITYNMADLTYEMVDELFPFAIQLQMMELIGETVSPSYATTKGK